MLGFIAASIIGTLYLQWVSDGKSAIATVNDLRTWFLIFAFVAIGLEFSLKGLKEAGWRPDRAVRLGDGRQHRRRARPGRRVVRQFPGELATLAGCLLRCPGGVSWL